MYHDYTLTMLAADHQQRAAKNEAEPGCDRPASDALATRTSWSRSACSAVLRDRLPSRAPAAGSSAASRLRKQSLSRRLDRQPGREARQLLEREQDARDERLARGRVVADRQRLPRPPRITSWCATRPGRRTEWIGTSPPMQRGGRLRRARRRVALRVGVQLDDLRARQHLRRLGREAHHQHRSEREVRRVEERDAALPPRARRARVRSAPVVPTTHGTPASSARVDVRRDGVGRREVDRGVGPASPAARRAATGVTSCPAASSAGASTEPTFPPRPEERDLHAAARARRPGCSRPSARLKRDSLGPMPDAESRSGASSTRRELRDSLGLDRVDLGDDPLEREQLGVGDQRLAEPAHPVRGRLHRERDAPLEVLLGALELASAGGCRRRRRRSARATISRHGARFSSRVPT